jgi:hypothetical protein
LTEWVEVLQRTGCSNSPPTNIGGYFYEKAKFLISLILLISFLIVCLSLSEDYKYVGSKKSDKFHYPSCKWAQKIKPEKLAEGVAGLRI